ncbi:unnamed protein product [Vicia faba]|uniref:Uncharacterized protein n=1 Tax=Vicia faba TaxID=3906 RepID=A0AAV1AVU1_VICFA|nr:unnamed protein product [Vicia faba]
MCHQLCFGLGRAGPKARMKAQSKRSCRGSRRSRSYNRARHYPLVRHPRLHAVPLDLSSSAPRRADYDHYVITWIPKRPRPRPSVLLAEHPGRRPRAGPHYTRRTWQFLHWAKSVRSNEWDLGPALWAINTLCSQRVMYSFSYPYSYFLPARTLTHFSIGVPCRYPPISFNFSSESVVTVQV